jgi:hypothetical protein
MTLTHKSLRAYKDREKALIDNSSGTVTAIATDDDDSTKVHGFITSRNNADNSMYVPVADSSGYERLWKLASEITANAGGYFETLFVNTQVAVTSTMAGIVRGMESKLTVLGNMGANAEGVGILAKVTAKGATAEVAHAIGVDVALEEDTSGTITKGTGIRVGGGAGVVTEGIDVSGVYDIGAINLPYVDGNAAVSIAALETAFGTDNAKQGVIGLYQDNTDAVWLIIGNAATGKYQKVAATAVTS